MVCIQKITTKGFKSYGSRVVSVTLSRNFTCIVGPNGSGKSNIIDAVSFVLGRLSTKSLRAEVLSDLIFAGTKKMNPAKYTEVSLHLDNTDGSLPFDRKEVIISRSVDTTGKSVYRVNRKRETRTYVLDILSQVGIFPEGHNLIMQGDITRFIKMSSWERRSVIEEISGIAEYNERRERGDRELEKAEENIARVELVINEVKKQMDRLEIEKSDALRYQFLKDEIFRNRGWLFKGQLINSKKHFQDVSENMKKNKTEIERNTHKISDIGSKIVEREETFDLISSEIEKLGEEKHLSISREIERLRGESRTVEQGLTFLEERRSQLEARKEREEKELDKSKRETGEEKEKIVLLEHQKEELDSEILKLKEDYQKHLSVLSEAGLENLEKVSQELDARKDEFFSLEAHINVVRNRLETLDETKIEVEGEIQTLTHQKEVLKKEIREMEEFCSETEKRIVNASERYTSAEEERKSLKSELSQIDSDFLEKRSESIRLHTKLQAFKEDQRASPQNAVNTILKVKDKIKGVYGTISQLGETEARYQTALEVAAGPRIENIVVDTTETARLCIEYLKEKKAGRATFLPLDRLQKRTFQKVTEKGVIDYAINLVQFDPKFRLAFEDVFSDMLVVEDIYVDMRGRRLVTLEGDVFERGGAMTGGFYFKRKYSSAFLISEDQNKFRKVQEEIQFLKRRREDMTERLQIVEPEIRSIYDEKLKLEERLPSVKKELDRMKREEDKTISEMQEREKELDSTLSELKSKNEELLESEEKKKEVQEKIGHLEREKEEISRPLKKDELARIEGELEIKRAKLKSAESEKVQAESRLHFLEENRQRIEIALKEMVPQLEDIILKVESKKKEMKEIERNLEEKIQDEVTFDEKIRNLRADRDKIREEISHLREEKDNLQKAVYQCESHLNVLESQKVQLEDRIKELTDLSAQYPVEGEYEDLKELDFKIRTMEREKEKLEPINMRAVEEFEDVQLRFIELKTRVDKLYQERQSILDFIAEVESQKKTVFFEAYYNVLENFARIFSELSPGGTGALILENTDDPFQGGLEIEASPMGKEVKRVEAMSGGEKALTALAFVFAVQQYKPAPFYFFDEIDAHLDDENLARVAELIKKSARDTQFIVITLRDVMMAAADLLYGVSMKEGISKIVSVELEKIAEYKEPQEVVAV